jgi:hypothetical protein
MMQFRLHYNPVHVILFWGLLRSYLNFQCQL